LKFWVEEEKQIREKFGYKKMFDPLYEKLQKRAGGREFDTANSSQEEKDYIIDATSYDQLAQQEYSSQYCYVPVYRRKNHKYDKECDFARQAFDYPYIKDPEKYKEFQRKVAESGQQAISEPDHYIGRDFEKEEGKQALEEIKEERKEIPIEKVAKPPKAEIKMVGKDEPKEEIKPLASQKLLKDAPTEEKLVNKPLHD
jgi:hypothetical protein